MSTIDEAARGPEPTRGRDTIDDAAPLELRAITVRYPRPDDEPLTVIEEYDLTVAPGTMHCLAGRSGSGKTSILRVAAGLVAPTEGAVLWGGAAITGLRDDAITERRRREVGYLDQGGALIPGLTALENVVLPAVPDRGSAALVDRARDLLGRLGVGGRAGTSPAALSGGERQRVALARAMLLSPRILMVDEPTASLDRASADTVIAMLRSLADEGTAVLVAAHDPQLIAAADSRTQMA